MTPYDHVEVGLSYPCNQIPAQLTPFCQPRDYPFSKDFAASSTYSPPSTIQIASWRLKLPGLR